MMTLRDDLTDVLSNRNVQAFLREQAVTSVGGRVVERVGDEILVTFAKPEKAALAASTLHQRMKMAPTKGQLACPMRLRISFEHGPITETEEAMYGATVHTAARLAALAKAGQTLTSKATLSRLPPILQRFSRFFDRVVLKGLPGEQEIHEILWSTDATTPSVSDPVRKTRVLSVELKYGESTVRVDASHPRVEIGRDFSGRPGPPAGPGCDSMPSPVSPGARMRQLSAHDASFLYSDTTPATPTSARPAPRASRRRLQPDP